MNEETDSPRIRQTESGYKYEVSVLRSVCDEAMISVGKSQNIDQFNIAINYLISSIDTLEAKLCPYHDREYLKERDKFNKIEIMTKDEFIKSRKKQSDYNPNKVDMEYDNYRLNVLMQKCKKKYEALMRLQDRKNLLLEEETEDYVGGKPG